MAAIVDTKDNTQYRPSQNDGEWEVTELTELYSRQDASRAIGKKTDITIKRWHANGQMVGIGVGQRTYDTPKGDAPKKQAFSLVYTQRMIDEAIAGNFPIRPLREEEESIMTTAEVAEFLGIPNHHVYQHSREINTRYEEDVYDRDPKARKNPKIKNYKPKEPSIPCVLIGSTAIYLREDVLAFKDELDNQEPEVVVVEKGRVGNYDLALAIANYMNPRHLTQAEFAKEADLPRQYVGKILRRQRQPLQRPAFLKLKEMLDGN